MLSSLIKFCVNSPLIHNKIFQVTKHFLSSYVNTNQVSSFWDRTRRGNDAILSNLKANNMLRLALIFFIVALIAGVLGFGGIAGAAAGIAKIIFWIGLALLVIALISNAVRKV